MTARPVLGVDLGTTYSCVAHLDDTGFRPSLELWRQAVKASGYVEATLSAMASDAG